MRCPLLVMGVLGGLMLAGCVDDPSHPTLDPFDEAGDAARPERGGGDAPLPDAGPIDVGAADARADAEPDGAPDAAADAAPDAAAPIACAPEGVWLLEYSADERFIYRTTDVLRVEGGVVTLDSQAGVAARATPCVEPVRFAYRWEGPCTLRIERAADRCGEDAVWGRLDVRLVFDDPPRGSGAGGMWRTYPDGVESPDPGVAPLDVQVTRLAPTAACAPYVDPRPRAAVRLSLPSDDVRWTGDVELVEAAAGEALVGLTLRGDDGVEVRVRVPSLPADIAPGARLWLDIDRRTPGGALTQTAYVLRRRAGGPVVAGQLDGGREIFADSAWSRAGLTFEATLACAPSWAIDGCRLAGWYRLTLDGTELSVAPGESVIVDVGGPARLLSRQAVRAFEAVCVEVYDEAFLLDLLPVE